MPLLDRQAKRLSLADEVFLPDKFIERRADGSYLLAAPFL